MLRSWFDGCACPDTHPGAVDIFLGGCILKWSAAYSCASMHVTCGGTAKIVLSRGNWHGESLDR